MIGCLSVSIKTDVKIIPNKHAAILRNHNANVIDADVAMLQLVRCSLMACQTIGMHCEKCSLWSRIALAHRAMFLFKTILSLQALLCVCVFFFF